MAAVPVWEIFRRNYCVVGLAVGLSSSFVYLTFVFR